MKTITFRKKWVKAISKLPKELRNDAIIALFNFLETGENDHPDTLISNLVWDVEHDIIKSAERSEKARQRREQKKAEMASQQAKSQPIDDPSLTFDTGMQKEYEEHPELYMFDGFMSYLISWAGKDMLPPVPDGMNVVTLLCFFRNWVIDNGKLGEMTKLNSFCGLFRHALPSLILKMAA